MNERVSGRMRYSLDLELPGMLHGAIVRSHSPHAVITGVELPGGPPEGCVLLTGAGVADCAPYGCLVPDTPVLAATRATPGIRWPPWPRPTRIWPRALRGPSRSHGAIFPRRLDLEAALAEGAPLIHDVQEVAARAGAWAGMRPLAGTNVSHRAASCAVAGGGLRRGGGRRRGRMDDGVRAARADGTPRRASRSGTTVA